MFWNRAKSILIAAAFAPWAVARAQTVLTVNDTRDLADYDLTDAFVDADNAMPGEQRTLRACIEQACTWGGAYRVILPAQTLLLNRFGADDACHWGDLDIFGAGTTQMSIEGVPGLSVLDASGFGTSPATADRIFDVQPNLPLGALIEIKDVRVQLGSRPGQQGGGIRHLGAPTLHLHNVDVVSCSTIASAGTNGVGGGIYAGGPLEMIGGSVSQCSATDSGGGLYVASGMTATLSGVSFADNSVTFHGGGAIEVAPGAALDATGIQCLSNDAVEGGGLRTRGVASVRGSAFISNVASAGAGSGGNVSVKDSQIAGSPATLVLQTSTLGAGMGGSGAGLNVGIATVASIYDTSFELNVSTSLGGGLSNSGTTTIERSTFSDNQADSGGGAHNFRVLWLKNCTFSGNRAAQNGGGLSLSGLNGDRCTLDACTIAGGQAARGGGIYLDGAFGTPLNEISSCFVADNRSTLTGTWQNAAGTGVIVSYGHNVDTDGTCFFASASDLSGTLAHVLNAGLGTLGFYGGPTRTLPLLDCSAAHCAGASFHLDGTFNDLDQRGVVRGAPPDCGAYDAPPVTAQSYCTAGTTSAGCVPSISGTGVLSGYSLCGFTIDVTGLEGQRQAVIFYGNNGPAAAPWGPGSTSFLCVKSPTQRTAAMNTGGIAGTCSGSLTLNFGAWLLAHPGAIGWPGIPGQTLYVQAWFRDPPAPKTTNLSNAIQFPVCP